MPKGYTLDADMQIKIEDERAGRLDHVYETDLSIADAIDRLKAKPDFRLRYETVTKDGILYARNAIMHPQKIFTSIRLIVFFLVLLKSNCSVFI